MRLHGTHVRAHAHCTFLGTPQGGRQADKSGFQGLASCPVLRVPNPFLALVCPSFNVSVGFWAQNLKV